VCQSKSNYRMLWVQLSGVKSGSGSSKRVEVETVPVVDPVLAFSGGGLIMPGEGKIEKIRVERSLEPN